MSKKNILKWGLSFLLMVLIVCPAFSQTSAVIFPDLLSIARSLPTTGILKKNSDGYVYLSVSNQFKMQLFPVLYKHLLPAEKDCLIPDNNPIGEHITIFNEGELNRHQLDQLPIDKRFKFHVLSVIKVDLLDKESRQSMPVHIVWYVVQVESKELTQLLQKMKVKHYPLHISFAVGRYQEGGRCLCVCDLLHCSK